MALAKSVPEEFSYLLLCHNTSSLIPSPAITLLLNEQHVEEDIEEPKEEPSSPLSSLNLTPPLPDSPPNYYLAQKGKEWGELRRARGV